VNSPLSRPVRCLFVGHDAYRGGATILLLNMLRWFKQHSRLEVEVALRDDGEMRQHFETIGPTHVLAPASQSSGLYSRLTGTIRNLRAPTGPRRRSLASLLTEGRFDLLYLNTITLGDQLATLAPVRLPVVVHVHELPSAIRQHARGMERVVLRHASRVICVSEAVRSSLVLNYPEVRDKTQVIHGFVPPQQRCAGAKPVQRQKLLEPLGVCPDAWVVGLCGYADLRKGADLLVPLAKLMPERIAGRTVHFVWVGRQASEYPPHVALDDAARAGVGARVHLVGATDSPLDWMACFDVHLLLSREDSFPLVVMEAAALGVPTVAFADAGGAAEFIGTDAGLCAPYLDLPAMAQALASLLADAARLQACGNAARERVRVRHSPDVVLPQVLRVIEQASMNGMRGDQKLDGQRRPRDGERAALGGSAGSPTGPSA
jgi:glycosyltransferase involved in cell wall biosynthesis